jgi:hypothetical protein
MRTLLALLALSLPMTATAGDLYGAVTRDGQALPREPLTVACSGGATAPREPVSTDDFGAYRLVIDGEGSCLIGVRGVAGAQVRVYRNAQRYNFEIKTVAGKPQLVQR